MAPRMPATLLHGRLRTSTLLLSLLFVAVLALYLQVRPPPAGTTSSSDGSGPAPSVPATTAISHLGSDLCARNNSHGGSNHVCRPHHHHTHTDDSTDIDHSEDHRELGDLWKPDHLAVATRRRTIYRF